AERVGRTAVVDHRHHRGSRTRCDGTAFLGHPTRCHPREPWWQGENVHADRGDHVLPGPTARRDRPGALDVDRDSTSTDGRYRSGLPVARTAVANTGEFSGNGGLT